MKLSVIILNYNVRYFLEQCLQSIQDAISGIEAEIIVIDNASSDDSHTMVATKFPSVTLIQNKENTGFPKGNNQGAAIAKGEYLCILNPDTVVAEDTFTKVLNVAAQHEHPGVIGVKLIDGTGNFLRESKRGVPTPWVAFTKIIGLYKIFPKRFGTYYAMHLKPEQSGTVAILVGAFMFVKRTVYNEVQGFDEGCFMYSDDIDLSYRIRQLGYTNYYFSETTVIHYKGESTHKNDYLRHFRQAMRFFYRKHFKINRLFDIFLYLGIQFFSMVKHFQFQSSEKKAPKPSQYILVSDNHALKSALEAKTGRQLRLTTPEKLLKEHPQARTEIILDGNQMSNTAIIALIARLKNKNYTFKIRPKNCRFIIGSHHRNAKGEILVF